MYSQSDPVDFNLFEALRETIYSEVATLISQNESRPHYLIELFRELQLMASDYLRQRALYAIQDLATQQLTEESLQDKGMADKQEKKMSSKVKVFRKLLPKSQVFKSIIYVISRILGPTQVIHFC